MPEMQNKYDVLFKSSWCGVIVTDRKNANKIVEVNDAICNFLGYTKKELLKLKDADIIYSGDKKAAQSKKKKGQQLEIEKRYIRKNKDILDCRVSSRDIFNEKGELIQTVSIVQDLSIRKINEKKLLESEENYRLISETARDLICLLDHKGKYVYISPSVKDVLGFEAEELLGTSPYLLFHPSDVTRIMTESESQEKSEESDLRYTLEYRMKQKGGKYIWLQTVTEPIKDDKGNIIKIQTSSRDITKMKKSEEKVKDLLLETQQLNRELEKKSVMLRKSLAESISLNEDLESREKLKNFLISIGTALSGIRDKDEVLNFILKELHPVVYFDGVGIISIDLENKAQSGFVFISEKNKEFETLSGKEYPLMDELTSRILESPTPIIIDGIKLSLDNNQSPLQKDLFEMGFKESMAVAIKFSGKNIGVLYLCSAERNCYNESQFDLIRGVAGQLGVAMSNIIAFKNEEKLRQGLEREVSYLNEEINSSHNFKEIIGETEALQGIMTRIRQVAVANTTVLINGESGTGKELIARGVHYFSNRSNRPLIKVNCAALPPQLIESELFGHEKGSFTGAINRRLGKFELAHDSTIFLDEIGELPLDLQAKILRVIQEKEFERVGGHKVIKSDTRIIAATNRDLEKEVAKGNFRLDLYYRLNVFPIHLPPLRQRKEDIPLLVAHFLTKLTKKMGKSITKISSESMQKMLEYDWPGNIRELEHVLERNAILAKGSIIDVELPHVQLSVPKNVEAQIELKSLEEVEIDHIVYILKLTNGRIRGERGAAELLNVKPTTLEAKMKKLGIVKKHVVMTTPMNELS